MADAPSASPPREAEGQAVLAQLRSLGAADPEFVTECADVFVEQAALELAELEAAVARGDASAAAWSAHRLKGSCAAAGAERMRTLCARIEARAHGGTTAGSEVEVRLLGALSRDVRDVIATHVGRGPRD